jgi:hypothetical protein
MRELRQDRARRWRREPRPLCWSKMGRPFILIEDTVANIAAERLRRVGIQIEIYTPQDDKHSPVVQTNNKVH